MTAPIEHPREVLFADGDLAPSIPVCDHYCGVEDRMRKSLALQVELGPVFDVTFDCEDGAPVGHEAEHVRMAVDLLMSSENQFGRVGARVHPIDHDAFGNDVETLIQHAGRRLPYIMVPKVRDLADAKQAIKAIDAAAGRHGVRQRPAVHFLIETHGALRDVFAIAALPRVQSLSFGLMDFVSAHQGAIPVSAMSAQGQFEHPLVRRAKLEIAAACHAAAKVPSHSVVTEFKQVKAIQAAASRAVHEFGYTRMWSIHPAQVQPIIEVFAPTVAELDEAIEIIGAAEAARWAPIRHRDTLHDRASYRYYWQVIERARRTRQPLPAEIEQAWFGANLAKITEPLETHMTFASMSFATRAHNAVAATCRFAACAVALSAMPLAWAADAQPKPQSPAANKQQREDRAKGLALGQETAQRVNENQLQIADRVLTGEAACEFNQTVSVMPIQGQPGHFHVTFKRVVYVVIPEETSSGAIRLEDKRAGIVWLQIPSKSMLMNARIGQRMVDGCMHAEQRAAMSAVQGAAPAAGRKP